MKVSCDEGLANHVGPESCGADREVIIEALTGESAGRVLSLENVTIWGADAVLSGGRPQRPIHHREDRPHPTWSQTPRTHRSISLGSREVPGSAWAVAQARVVNPKGVRRR
jgi:hypothetical protein